MAFLILQRKPWLAKNRLITVNESNGLVSTPSVLFFNGPD